MRRFCLSCARTLLSAAALSFAHHGMAQAPPAKAARPVALAEQKPQATAPKQEVKAMGTGESLGFMGRSLWFEMRRRLNLTTEEEEAQHKAETRQVKLKVGGIGVSREAVPEKEPVPGSRR